MRAPVTLLAFLFQAAIAAGQPSLIARPDAFPTLVNPACSHCRDEAKRRSGDLRDSDRVLCWLRGYSDGGAIPIRFFLSPYRVISDSYGVFVFDPDAGFARGFAPSYEFRFHGWRNGVMVMKHKDGTVYSCLTGLAFDGPKKGSRLRTIPTLVSDWGFWLEHYPNAVAYHMFAKYQPVELVERKHPDSMKSRGKPDPRLKAGAAVLGVYTEKAARAYPIDDIAKPGLLSDRLGGESLVILWEPRTRTASAYRPLASQPRKYHGPRPDATGVSPPDPGELPAGAPVQKPRVVALQVAGHAGAGRFVDTETHSFWDVAGRCVDGKLKGWTLEWVDSVQVKWFAWAAENPGTTLFRAPKASSADAKKKIAAIAGTAEFLRLLPKPFATIQAIDPKERTVTLVLEGEKKAKVWPVEPDAEVKVGGWWGRLEQFRPGQRIWAWLKLNRKKQPVSVAMLADELTEVDMHGSLRGTKGTLKFTPAQVEAGRTGQQGWLRKRWVTDGLPGTLMLHHVFSGELDVALDHEAMRWGRALAMGDTVHLTADPPIKCVVKTVTPWHERTIVRLVVGELESSELKIGQRLGLKMTPPSAAVETSRYPPDMGRTRSKAERVEWLLASVYCSCGVAGDRCTGHFYTLASCNPNGCAMPNHIRSKVGELIDQGLDDRRIFDAIATEACPLCLRPHLMP